MKIYLIKFLKSNKIFLLLIIDLLSQFIGFIYWFPLFLSSDLNLSWNIVKHIPRLNINFSQERVIIIFYLYKTILIFPVIYSLIISALNIFLKNNKKSIKYIIILLFSFLNILSVFVCFHSLDG
jgi:hypothetical protein